MNKRGLGKGLEALFVGTETADPGVSHIKIDSIIPRTDQPRKKFAQEALEELAASIKQHGILQPLLVRSIGNDKYELIAGERRLKAAYIAGMEYIPAVIKELDDLQAREAALIENLQREDLSPVEEALAYREMIEKYGYTQEKLSEKIGKSRAYVANTIRLLNLPESVLNALAEGKLSPGHARAILALKDPEQQVKLANRIIRQGLNVRETERAAKERIPKMADPNLLVIEERLQEFLGTRVKLVRKDVGGKIEVDYYNDEDLSRLLELIGLRI